MKYEFKTKNGGLVLSTQPFWNGNVIYATDQAIELGYDADGLYRKGLEALEPKPGVLSRYEDRLVNTSVDDYLARCCDPEFAKRFLRHGRTHFGFFDCEPGFWPKPKQFLFRFQGLWQHAKLSAGEKLGCIGRYMWIKSMRLTMKEPVKNQDAWIQSHLMAKKFIESHRGQGSPRDMLFTYSDFLLRKPAPTSQIISDYIGDPLHPLVRLWGRYP